MKGNGPAPSLVLSLIQRLPDDSMTVALASGGKELFGWRAERFLLSDIFDAINVNTRATGNWKKDKVPDFPIALRPKLPSTDAPTEAEPQGKPRMTVAELYKRFTGGT